MSNEEKSFRERLSNDISTVKKMLYMQEIVSAFLAIAFGLNIAIIVFFPFGAFTILNLFVIWYVGTFFRKTVKRQIIYHEHIKLLNALKKEKVWTQADK